MEHEYPYSTKRHGKTLEKCEDEPVQTPGCVQAHGVLLVLRLSDLTILQASENSRDWLGVSPGDLLAKNVTVAVGESVAQTIRDALDREKLAGVPLYLATLQQGQQQNSRSLHITLHTCSGLALLELEDAGVADPQSLWEVRPDPDYYGLVRKSLTGFQEATSLKALSLAVAEEVRRITELDRVMVYYFHADDSGEIIAECKREDHESWLGWRYPAHDIPRPAREIFKKIWSRPVPDIRGQLFEMVPLLNPDTRKPLDMTYCSLRGASVMYTEYLDNMGVRAAFTLPLRREGEVWGLVACHGDAPGLISYRIRAACEFLARGASQQILRAEEREKTEYRRFLEGSNLALIAKVSRATDLSAFMEGDLHLGSALNCGGAAILSQEIWNKVGQTPGTQEMAELGQWLLTQPAFQKESPYPIFVTDRLSELYPPAKEFAGSGSGLMAFCFSRSPLGLILYFKPEALQTLTWGGDPHALPVVQGPDGPRLSPRESFKAWRETVRNRSLPWKTVEIESILKLRGLIIDMLIARTEQLSARRRLGGRTEELAASQRELVELGRNAGIAEGSIDPVHEMGHLLNSVNVSATIAIDKIRGFRLATLDRLAEMQGGLQDLQTFFTSDPRAAHVPVFLTNLAGLLESDRDAVLRDLDELSLNVEHINAIVTKQQKHAKNFGLTEVPPLAELLEEIRADITERKHAEEAALRLAEIVNSSADAIIGKTLEGVITSWNAGAERVFGYAASEVIGRSVKILFPPALLFEEAETRARTACGESVKHFDTLRVRKDGTLVNVSVVCSPVTDSEGKIIGVAKIARNVTARKQVEQALAASEMRYRRLFESSKDGILILDAESGMVVDVNPSLVELLGFSHRAFLGKKVWELGFFEDLVANESNFAELREKDYIRFEDKPLKTADGRRIDVEFISNVYIVNGEKVIQCNIRDVTERKQLALAIRESEERFRTMANSISQLAWIARVDGSRFWYNQRWYEYTGTTSGQMEGWDWQSVHDPETLPHVLARWKAAIDSGEPFEMEFPLRGADGKFRTFLTRALPLKDAAGRVMQWFGTNTDVETLKQAEEKIHLLNTELEERVVQRTAQLEAANKELEAFSYSVSHDLRAPLRAVDGFSQAVLEDYGPLLPEDGQRCLTTIREGAQRMGALIDDLLTFSRLSRLPITKQPVDANRQVRETLLELKDEQAGRTIEIRVGELPAYNADPALMKQVWVNLLSNALKYSRNRERTLLEIDSIQQNVRTVYFVRDNGTGFDMRYAHKLFGVFQRLHRQEEFAGTGVGLAIVQRIVHRHGGRIWADAAPDRGATFFFTLEPETPS